MKTIGLKEVAHTAMILPGDFRQLLLDPDVKRMAANINQVGGIEPPVLRKIPSGLVLLCGRNRVAAHAILGRPVECKLVTCEDSEVEAIIKSENAVRHHDAAKAREDVISLKLDLEKEFVANPPPQPEGKRKKRASTLAREEAARMKGVKPSTLRVQEYRQRKAAGAPPPADQTEIDPKDPPIALVVTPLDVDLQRKALAMQRTIDGILEHISLARTRLRKAIEAGDCHTARLDRFAAQLAEMSGYGKALRPVSVCPLCKAVPQVQKQCVTCNATGYITQDQHAQVQATYFSARSPVVLFEKKQVPLSSVLPEEDAGPEWAEETEDPWGLG